MFIFSWNCKDKRFLIKYDTEPAAEFISGSCQWDTQFDLVPADLTCELTYCTNATKEPLDVGVDYGSAIRNTRRPYNFQVIDNM